MNKLIRDNFVLFIGISLPILLVLVFWLSVTLPKFWVAPPQYDLLFATYDYHYNTNPKTYAEIEISNGRIKIWGNTPSKQSLKTGTNQVSRLFIYESKKQVTREIPIPLYDTNTNSEKFPISISEIENMKLSTSQQSPDGYAINQGRYYNDGLGGLFFSSYDTNYGLTLSKDGNIIKVTVPSNSYYNIKFLGWVISK